MNEPQDWIHLSQVSFPCMLGLFDWEQREPQQLSVEVHLNLDLDPAAFGDLSRSVNYRTTLDQVQFIAQHGRWLLLESMAAAIARHLLAAPGPGERRASVRAARIKLAKPNILAGRGIPTVEILRYREFVGAQSEPVGATTVLVLQETRQTGAYRLHFYAPWEWTAPTNAAVHVVAGQFTHAAQELAPGGSALLKQGDAIASQGPATLLVVSQPPLPAAGA